MTEAVRLWFIGLFSLGLAGTVTGYVRFRRHRGAVEQKVGPLPTPGPLVVATAGSLILLTGLGEIDGRLAAGWWVLRGAGVALSLYALVTLPLAARALGRFGVPGVAVLTDHGLITSGPFRLVRHPGYSAVLALWLGAALGTLNWLLLISWPVLLGVMLVISRDEEVLLRRKFGSSYDAYARRTGRFFPGLSKRRRSTRGGDDG